MLPGIVVMIGLRILAGRGMPWVAFKIYLPALFVDAACGEVVYCRRLISIEYWFQNLIDKDISKQ